MSAKASRPLAASGPRASFNLLDRKSTALGIGLLASASAIAWAVTAWQAGRTMGVQMSIAQAQTSMPMEITAFGFMATWLAMTSAMMLPTIAPIVLAHQSVVRQRGEGWPVTAVFVSGYLLIWTLIGLVPLATFIGLQMVPVGSHSSHWLGMLAGGILVVAGLYQFTPLKSTCLRACRSPLGFILSHDFSRGAIGAIRAGMSHGAYCLGCCWALMSVLVVVGTMNIGWMVTLSFVFFLEKNWRHGPLIDRFVGFVIALAGAAIVVDSGLLRLLAGAT